MKLIGFKKKCLFKVYGGNENWLSKYRKGKTEWFTCEIEI